MSQRYQLGKGLKNYMDGRAQSCTLAVTEQCNLRCKYCYQPNKNPLPPMSREVAFRAIDFFLEMPDPREGILLEFTGGECSLEVDLIRETTQYFKEQLRRRDGHPWQFAYMFMFSTNGTLYHTDKFQRLLWVLMTLSRGMYSYGCVNTLTLKQKLHSAVQICLMYAKALYMSGS